MIFSGSGEGRTDHSILFLFPVHLFFSILLICPINRCDHVVHLSCSPQFDMQQMSLEELKQVLFDAFRDHLTMKDIENIIVNEEESLKENSGNCHTEFEEGRLS